MGKFADKKKEIYASSLNKDGKIRRTSNRRQFDELGTALLNDPDYKEVVKRTHGGKTTEVETTPVADLRKAMIGGIAKDAGLDSAEAAKLIENHEFSTLPLYSVVAAMLEGYCEAGKTFVFNKRDDLQGSLFIEEKEQAEKTYHIPPGRSNESTVTSVYGKHRVWRTKSRCPKHLVEKVK